MTIFWVSFRIEYEPVGGKSYDARYDAFMNALSGLRGSYWEETTSFIIFDSQLSIAAIAMMLKAAIAPSKDLFVLRQLDAQSAMFCGDLRDSDLLSLMPYVKKA